VSTQRTAPPSGTRSRRAILDAASGILSAEGVHALSMRRLSQAVGASTIVLYTHFSDKQDILNELYIEGFTRLQAELDAVPTTDDPAADVAELGRAYRRSAIANPTYYQIMFSDCIKDFSPSREAMAQSRGCFDVLRGGTAACEAAGLLQPGTATETAQVLWGTLHGLISLELLGYAGTPEAGEQRLELAIAMLQAGLSSPVTTPSDQGSR
jgi:AcrR family transcriptional regulator